MENIIPAVTGKLITPLLETSNWEPLQDIENIMLKANVQSTTTVDGTSATTGGWILNKDNSKLYTYSQEIEVPSITAENKFFVDLDLSKYTTKDEILNAQEDWALIGRAVGEDDGAITFYIYDDAAPSIDLYIKIRFANTAPIIE